MKVEQVIEGLNKISKDADPDGVLEEAKDALLKLRIISHCLANRHFKPAQVVTRFGVNKAFVTNVTRRAMQGEYS